MLVTAEYIPKSIFMINEYDYPTFSVELISYVCKYNDGKIKLIDHDRYEWIAPEGKKKEDFYHSLIPFLIPLMGLKLLEES